MRREIILSSSLAMFLTGSTAWCQQNCNTLTPHQGWTQPMPLAGAVNTCTCSEKSPDERDNGVELYFHRENCSCLPSCTGCDPNNLPAIGLYVSRRGNAGEPWGDPAAVLNNTDPNNPVIIRGAQPSISSDGNYLYYSTRENGPCGINFNIHYAIRDPNNPPELNLWLPQGPVQGPINTDDHDEQAPSISSDGRVLYFCRMRVYETDCMPANATHDIFRAWGGQPYLSFPLTTKETVLSIDDYNDLSPDVSSDYSLIVFDRQDASGDGVWIAARVPGTLGLFPPAWCSPQKILVTDDPNAQDKSPCISGLNNRILFRSTRVAANKSDIYETTKP